MRPAPAPETERVLAIWDRLAFDHLEHRVDRHVGPLDHRGEDVRPPRVGIDDTGQGSHGLELIRIDADRPVLPARTGHLRRGLEHADP